MKDERTTVALTLGDPAGIGPELVAGLLARPQTLSNRVRVVVVSDAWLWEQGQQSARVRVETESVQSLSGLREHSGELPLFCAVDTVRPDEVVPGQAGAAGGRSSLRHLDVCLEAARSGQIDAVCFAPLNKLAMKLGGLGAEDELHYFAGFLNVSDYFCEFNTLDGLWTARVSSHVPLKDVARYVTPERITGACRLIHRSLQAAGNPRPRIAVAALNPHGGEGGTCGREEVDVIAPAVAALKEEGLSIQGPFPADTIFLRARSGHFDAVVTLYHDQGQIALKLLGFEKGVTVHGGLPIPITTPAHGTAYDIVGQRAAQLGAMCNAYQIACTMGAAYRLPRGAVVPDQSGSPSSS